MAIRKKGLLIFDMDGTLVDSMNLHAEIFSKILNETCGAEHEALRREYLRTAGQPLDEQISNVLTSAGESSVRVAQLVDSFWAMVDHEQPVLFSDVKAVVEQLWLAGYSLVVISGCAPFVVESKMRKTGLSQYFSLMLGTDKKVRHMFKGDGHFRIIRRSLNLDRTQFQNNSLFIADAEYDMPLAKRAGLLAIGRVTHGNAKTLKEAGADLLIEDLWGLISILQPQSQLSKAFSPVADILEVANETSVY